MSPSACGGSVGTTGEALLQPFEPLLVAEAARLSNAMREAVEILANSVTTPHGLVSPLRSHDERLSKGEKQNVSLFEILANSVT